MRTLPEGEEGTAAVRMHRPFIKSAHILKPRPKRSFLLLEGINLYRRNCIQGVTVCPVFFGGG